MEIVNIQKYTKDFRCDILDYKDNKIAFNENYMSDYEYEIDIYEIDIYERVKWFFLFN